MLRTFVLFFLFVVAAPLTLQAEAWLQPKNGYFFKLSGSYLLTGEEYNYNGDKQVIGAEDPVRFDAWFRDITIEAYAEYGAFEKLTLVARLPYKILSTRQTESPGPAFPASRLTRTNHGLADLDLLARLPIVQGATAIAFQGGAKLPLFYDTEPENNGAVLGTGHVDGIARIILGRSLYPLSAYAETSIGYRYRGGEFNDEVTFTAEAGGSWRRLFAKLRFEGLENTVPPPDIAGGTVVTPLPGGGGTINDRLIGDQDAYKLLGTASVRVAARAEIAGEFFHVLGGANTLAGTTWSLGLVLTR